MARLDRRKKRDIEKDHPVKQFAAKLPRLASCIEEGRRFSNPGAGERISISPDARINIEHKRSASRRGDQFQLVW